MAARVGVVDYGMGNLRSMAKALEHVGADPVVTSHEAELRAAERIVLPGVGAFGEAIENLRATGLVDALREEVLERGKPFLGVCVGMQLLAAEGHEHGIHEGLGWINARVVPLEPEDPALAVPHTGWNEVEPVDGADSPVARIRPGECFYFNHGYHLEPADDSIVAARCTHGAPFAAALASGNLVATQFHPEKSQQAGLELLADFVYWEPARAPGQAIRTSTP
jgi:glutamine amidotransferase